jgi:hypothetical protein
MMPRVRVGLMLLGAMNVVERKKMRQTGLMRMVSTAAVCLGAFAAAGGIQTAHGQAPAGEVITVTAKLVEIPSKLPPDDLYDYAYVMRYQVQGGPMDKAFILVAHYKPRQARGKIKDKMKDFVGGKLRNFNQGDVHKLKLTADLKKIWKGALTDEYAATDRQSVRYWALEADPA